MNFPLSFSHLFTVSHSSFHFFSDSCLLSSNLCFVSCFGCLSPCICLPVCQSVCVSHYLLVCLTASLPACLLICLSICLSPSLSPCLSLSVCLSFCISFCLFAFCHICIFISFFYLFFPCFLLFFALPFFFPLFYCVPFLQMWVSGRQLCEVRSLTGRHCIYPVSHDQRSRDSCDEDPRILPLLLCFFLHSVIFNVSYLPNRARIWFIAFKYTTSLLSSPHGLETSFNAA